ncbi:TIGR02452 family protein [Clostridium sp. FP2]|uniref:TIGR02452 family protein n=1 Tax=Clostridium sp. FP2 TaxID=2724481 RepID=UPI0013E9538A|nr:TIGR02452 family protein [Clostridium sp. FP2]MBZ9624424.1 TIGR02452 family protein [Clostridium sp. FP2]
MINNKKVEIANDTLNIIKLGYYQTRKGPVKIKDYLQFAIKNTVLYNPDMGSIINSKFKEIEVNDSNKAIIEITNETTLQATERLSEEGDNNLCCLNFASAKHPGGGFLKGSVAQEETLARSSGLYPCISQIQEMYNYHLYDKKTALYSDYMIYSPKVPFFKDDNGGLLENPYLASVITSAAVNAGVIKRSEPYNISKIDEVMINRIDKILSIGVIHGVDCIVLGAFGCGVFANDPNKVADYFKSILLNSDKYTSLYKKIVFAIYDKTPNKNNYKCFKDILDCK